MVSLPCYTEHIPIPPLAISTLQHDKGIVLDSQISCYFVVVVVAVAVAVVVVVVVADFDDLDDTIAVVDDDDILKKGNILMLISNLF